MNRNQNSHNTASAQGKSLKAFSRLLRQFFAAKTVVSFDLSLLNQEKLPIIYANIRV